MRSISASGYSITVRTILWPIQLWLILIWFALLTALRPTLPVTNSFLFRNISTSLTQTHSSMDRLTLLPSTIEKVRTEFVNPTGTFSNPIVISITTHFRVLMCQHTQFTSMLAPTLPSIPPLYRVTFSCRHNAHFIPHVSTSPLTKGLWRTLPPQIFLFFNTIKLWAPSRCDKRLLRESMKILILTSHVFCFRLIEILFWWILLFHRLAEICLGSSSTVFWVA